MRDRYFVRVSSSYTPKNRLQTEVVQSLKKYDGYLLWNITPLDLHKTIQNEVSQFNEGYTRCTPLELQTVKFNNELNSIYIENVIHLSIKKVTQIL